MKSRHRRLRVNALHRSQFTPRRIHFDKLDSVLAPEFQIVALLQSLLANTVALGIAFKLGELQLVFRNLACITQHVRSERTVRVFATRFNHRHDARQFGRMFFDKRHLFRRSVFEEGDRPVPNPAAALERRIEGKRIEQANAFLVLDTRQTVKNGIAFRHAPRKAHRLQCHLVRRPVAHENNAVAVIDVTAFGNEHHLPDAVVF